MIVLAKIRPGLGRANRLHGQAAAETVITEPTQHSSIGAGAGESGSSTFLPYFAKINPWPKIEGGCGRYCRKYFVGSKGKSFFFIFI